MRTKERSAEPGVRDLDRALEQFEQALDHIARGIGIAKGMFHDPSDPKSSYDPLNALRLAERDRVEALMTQVQENLMDLNQTLNAGIDRDDL